MDQSELSLKDLETADNGPVECLGKTFANDEGRRTYFLGLLAEKLKDPEFRKIEGFPIGEDEDILNLSDPPYYTACPNPFIEDFIRFYGKPYNASEGYKREPYAADVSEGRSGLFYDAHSYHTKVPHKAIMRYLLHYTKPGDVVMDAFAGTGMAGVAGHLCGNRRIVEELGYYVDSNENIYEQMSSKQPFSKIGPRLVILNDLSPAASFIAANFNSAIKYDEFINVSQQLLKKANDEIGWVYCTSDNIKERSLLADQLEGKRNIIANTPFSRINYIIWSDVYECGNCASDLVFWDEFYNDDSNKLDTAAICPECGSTQTKKSMLRKFISEFDIQLDAVVKIAKQVPVIIDYTNWKGERKQKKPDDVDMRLIEHIKTFKVLDSVNALPNGVNTEQPRKSHGVEYLHQFYTARNLVVLNKLRAIANESNYRKQLLFLISSYDLSHSTKMTRIIFKKGKKPVLTGYQSGTLYMSSLPVEKNILTGIEKQKLPIISKSLKEIEHNNLVQVGSASSISVPDDSLDYIFIDPPFGANINYSELNNIAESSLNIFTENSLEAIENKVQKKGLNEYRDLMRRSFSECYRVLKPGRWMTVEFSNTSAAVWNSIQEGLTAAGFIIANVSALSKQQGSFKAVTTPTAVKQDLVISAYKPDGGFEERFQNETDIEGFWDFVTTHLSYLPIYKTENDALVIVQERDPRLLFDQVVAYLVKHLRSIPLSSKEFQDGLREKYAERDGMIFLGDQVAEYDKARLSSKQLKQLSIFVDDEASAIEWLRQLLDDKPQTRQEIHPKFTQVLSGIKKGEELVELDKLLEQNFIRYDGECSLPPQIHSYLSSNFKEMRNLPKSDPRLIKKAKDRWYVPNPDREEDLQIIRERDLLKQFDEYKTYTGRKLKSIRIESVRCGFKKAWQQRDYSTIIQIAKKIPQNLLQEDQKLLMWYDQSLTRMG
jgi:hypothetical protein